MLIRGFLIGFFVLWITGLIAGALYRKRLERLEQDGLSAGERELASANPWTNVMFAKYRAFGDAALTRWGNIARLCYALQLLLIGSGGIYAVMNWVGLISD